MFVRQTEGGRSPFGAFDASRCLTPSWTTAFVRWSLCLFLSLFIGQSTEHRGRDKRSSLHVDNALCVVLQTGLLLGLHLSNTHQKVVVDQLTGTTAQC